MSEKLQMRVGSNIGEILLNIVQERILKGDIDYAMRVYPDAFGMNNEHTMGILRNEYVIITDEGGETVTLSDTEEERNLNTSNIYDWQFLIEKKIESLKDIYAGILDTEKTFDKITNRNIRNYSIIEMMEKYFTKEELHNIGIHNIAAAIIGAEDNMLHNNQYDNPQSKWDDFESKFYGYDNISETDTSNWEKILFLTVRYNKLIRLLHKEYMTFDNTYDFLIENKFIKKPKFIEEFIENVIRVLREFSDTSTGYYHPMCNELLYNYKEKLSNDLINTVHGKEFFRYGILKKDIMDGYDAGWLSPDGEFYGGNGPTSAMIHMTIAEQIFNASTNVYAVRMANDGVSVWGDSSSPEYWLEKHGWVKIHHEDCYGSFIGRRDEEPTPDFPYAYNPTDIQIKMICDYADKFYGGKFYTEANVFGRMSHKEPYSTYKVRQMDEFKIHEIFH